MEANPIFINLTQMGINPTMAEAAIKKNKTQDVSVLLDWISQHQNQEVELAEWLKNTNSKPANQSNLQAAQGQSISHLVNQQFNAQLQSLGHSKNVSEKAIFLTGNNNLEKAKNWIQDHKYDPDFEQELKMVGQPKSELTEQQAKQKLKQLQAKIRQNRKKKEEQDALERQKNRMRYGKQLVEAKRMAQEIKVKKQMELDKIQKQRDQQYKRKLKAQMRKQRCQKLGIPYDEKQLQNEVFEVKKPQLSKSQAVTVQLQQVRVGSYAYPEKIVLCFKTIILYLENIIKNPTQPKFRKINTENNAFKTRIGEIFGGELAIQAIGFVKQGTLLVLQNPDIQQLKEIVKALERYLAYY